MFNVRQTTQHNRHELDDEIIKYTQTTTAASELSEPRLKANHEPPSLKSHSFWTVLVAFD